MMGSVGGKARYYSGKNLAWKKFGEMANGLKQKKEKRILVLVQPLRFS